MHPTAVSVLLQPFLLEIMLESELRMSLDSNAIRQEFPILQSGELIYLDSAATSQKPQMVLDAMGNYYKEDNANVHRGMHLLAERATITYEAARKRVADYIGCASHEVIFTKSCTEAINLVAKSWGEANLQKGDTVLLSILEHHSNVIPWMQLKEKIGIQIEWMDIDDDGNLKLDDVDLTNVKLISVTGLSNVLGTMPDLKMIIEKAHAAGVKVLIDAAQLIAHHEVNVQDLDCDFLAFSGHKVYGPTGIGVLYGKREILEQMPPFLGGGMMIGQVTTDGFTSAEIPQKFEAGTPPIAEAAGLTAALNWISQYNWKDIEQHESDLLQAAIDMLTSIDGVKILGTPQSGCVSFTMEDVHPHDLTEIIGRKGVCLRAGHHCAEPLHKRLGVAASARLSIALYNETNEMDTVIKELEAARSILS